MIAGERLEATVAEAKAGIDAGITFHSEPPKHQSLHYRGNFRERLLEMDDGFAELLRFCRLPSESDKQETLAFAHIPTEPIKN